MSKLLELMVARGIIDGVIQTELRSEIVKRAESGKDISEARMDQLIGVLFDNHTDHRGEKEAAIVKAIAKLEEGGILKGEYTDQGKRWSLLRDEKFVAIRPKSTREIRDSQKSV